MISSRIAETTRGLFAHAPFPLEHTLEYRGDPGLHGPESMSWPIIADPAAFVGGIRALLIQAAHPEVVAGVADHSRYREDPLGRLSRTSAYVTATTFGAMPEVEAAIDLVERRHQPVRGTSERGIPYTAEAASLSAWVHNVLTDSFLEAHRRYGPAPITVEEADRFVAEQARVGRLMGADPIPETAAELSRWVAEHPDLSPTQGMRDAIGFLKAPPLPLLVRLGYRRLLEAAVATIPSRLQSILGLRRRSPQWIDRTSVRTLRRIMGSSPSWKLALIRVDAPIPPGLFKAPLPVDPSREA